MLKGRIKVAVKKLGEKKVSLSWSVLEAIEIQDMDNHSIAMMPASPVFSVTGDGVAKTIALELAIPQTDVRLPWDPKEIDAKNSDLHISVGGVHGKSTLSESAEELAFEGLGVGASFVEVRTTKIFELGFNAANGHKMDLKIKPLAGDQARFEITPKLDLSLAFALQMVAAEFNADEQPEPWMLGQTLSVLMTGASKAVAETVQESETFDGGVKMVEGSLSLSTSADTNATVSVPMGQCLTENATPGRGVAPAARRAHVGGLPGGAVGRDRDRDRQRNRQGAEDVKRRQGARGTRGRVPWVPWRFVFRSEEGWGACGIEHPVFPDLSLGQWLLGAGCAFAVGLAKTGVPGFGILVVPLMVLAVGDARQSAGWLLPLLCIADVFAVVYYRRHAQTRQLFHLAPWVLVGMGAGALALGAERAVPAAGRGRDRAGDDRAAPAPPQAGGRRRGRRNGGCHACCRADGFWCGRRCFRRRARNHPRGSRGARQHRRPPSGWWRGSPPWWPTRPGRS